MSYTKQNWQSGDTITAQKLNHIEDGIADSGVLVVNVTPDIEAGTATLDKTWQQMFDAAYCVICDVDNVFKGFYGVRQIDCINEGEYEVFDNNNTQYVTDSADGYPVGGSSPK